MAFISGQEVLMVLMTPTDGFWENRRALNFPTISSNPHVPFLSHS